MNEHEALELFAPAREREMPPARFSFQDVYAADARLRRRRRTAAVSFTVAVVIAIVAGFALSGTGSSRSIRPAASPTAAMPTGTTAVRSPTAVSVPGLVGILDRLPIPSPATEVATPADGQAVNAAGYSTQPGYEQAVRYWTTTLTPEAAIAAMTTRIPTGMTGSVRPPMPNKGQPDAQADYKAAGTTRLVGPRLELYAIALGDGRTAVSALAWQIDESLKPPRLRISGAVDSVTGTYSEPEESPQTGTISGGRARQLAVDFNALLTDDPSYLTPCSAGAPALSLVFHTSTGDHSVRDTCGLVTVLPSSGAKPDLETSDAFNLDVNNAFADLMPEPLPSSAPLPTVAASATLVVGVTVVGGPKGTPNAVDVAGTISLTHAGVRAGGGAVAKGHTLALKVAPGSYRVSVSEGGIPCVPQTATVATSGTTRVTIICNIK